MVELSTAMLPEPAARRAPPAAASHAPPAAARPRCRRSPPRRRSPRRCPARSTKCSRTTSCACSNARAGSSKGQRRGGAARPEAQHAAPPHAQARHPQVGRGDGRCRGVARDVARARRAVEAHATAQLLDTNCCSVIVLYWQARNTRRTSSSSRRSCDDRLVQVMHRQRLVPAFSMEKSLQTSRGFGQSILGRPAKGRCCYPVLSVVSR